MSVETIRKRLTLIEDLKADARRVKDLIDESLESNKFVQEAQERKEQFLNDMLSLSVRVKAFKDSPEVKGMTDELKQIKTEIKENKEIVSQELADYYKETGKLEIVDEDGNNVFIKFDAKLKK